MLQKRFMTNIDTFCSDLHKIGEFLTPVYIYTKVHFYKSQKLSALVQRYTLIVGLHFPTSF